MYAVFTMRCYAQRGYAIIYWLAVCLSVTLRYVIHAIWNTSINNFTTEVRIS